MTSYYACAKSVVWEKVSANIKPARCRTRILSDSARKRNGKEDFANYYKTRINIGHQLDHWIELKEVLRVQSHAEVQTSVMHVVQKLRHA